LRVQLFHIGNIRRMRKRRYVNLAVNYILSTCLKNNEQNTCVQNCLLGCTAV
jgi:hypothetical protein